MAVHDLRALHGGDQGAVQRQPRAPRSGTGASRDPERAGPLEGEWIDLCGGVDASTAAYLRADAYIDTIDDDAWLVCLSVHF